MHEGGTSVRRPQRDDTCTGRNVPPEKTFSTQADVVVGAVTALRGCWLFRGHLLRANLNRGHNEMDNTNISFYPSKQYGDVAVLLTYDYGFYRVRKHH